MPRYLIANDESGKWFIRHIRAVEHDLERDEKVYHCDRPAGDAFESLLDAVQALQLKLSI